MRPRFYITLLLPVGLLALAACGGGGDSGRTPPTTPGQNSVVTAARNTAPIGDCPSGGISIDAGIDTNSNGRLDASEVTSTQYICNGADGARGQGALVSITAEPTGANCPIGGSKVSVGPDGNANGILDSAEITSSHYICNGVNGTNGTNGTDGINGANGSNGINGLNSLAAIVPEPAGTNCTYGGNKMTSGLDTNANGVLEQPEVDSTSYLCNGAPGPGVNWQTITSTVVQMRPNTGYLVQNPEQVTVTLPIAPSVGDVMRVNGIGTGGWRVGQNAGQSIVTKNLPAGDVGDTWRPRTSVLSYWWSGIASSADGIKLVAVALGKQIYTSADSGVTWTARDAARNWFGVASSADGTKLVAVVAGGQIYTSTDSGVNWIARDAARNWFGVASSADGTKLVATVLGGQIYTSTNSGENWTARDVGRPWWGVASSADGTKLVVATETDVYTSTDSGENWTPRTGVYAFSVASSADGTKLFAAHYSLGLRTSTNSGLTWTKQTIPANCLGSVSASADGTKLVATGHWNWPGDSALCTSKDSGVTWATRDAPLGGWGATSSSANGDRLAATVVNGQIHVSSMYTTLGITGGISGGQYDALELQYRGGDIFTVLSHEGNLTVE